MKKIIGAVLATGCALNFTSCNFRMNRDKKIEEANSELVLTDVKIVGTNKLYDKHINLPLHLMILKM